MRRILLLAALLAIPTACAQEAPVEFVAVEVAPFEEPVRPLQGPQVARITVRASCLLVDDTSQVHVTLRVAKQPSWATSVVSPTQSSIPVERCEQGYGTLTADLIVTANDQAPAFHPEPIVVKATAGPATRQREGEGMTNVTASYFAILDVSLAEAIAVVRPGGAVDFPLTITSFSNGPTRVEFVLSQAPPSLAVELPSPLRLGSRQSGDADISAEPRVIARALEERGFVNRVETFSVAVRGAYALDDSLGNDASTVSMLVTIRSDGGDARRDVPLGGAVLAAVIAALLARR